MEKIIRTISALAPFLAAYPTWVKALFAAWIIIGAVLFVALVFGKQQSSSVTQARTNNSGSVETLLIVRGVRAYNLQFNEGVKVKVVANVNGNKFVYPSGTQAEWLEIGQNMSPQKFVLPPMKNGYDVKFTMTTLYEGKETEMISQWVESIKNLPFAGQYELHAFHPASRTRSGEVSASVMYEIRDSE